MNIMIFFMYSYVVIIMIVTHTHAMENSTLFTPQQRKHLCIRHISYFFNLPIPEVLIHIPRKFERYLNVRMCAQRAILDLKDSGDNYINNSRQYVHGKDYYLYFKNKFSANGIPESSVFCYKYEIYYPPPEGSELINFVDVDHDVNKMRQLCIEHMAKSEYLGKTNKEAVEHAFYTVVGHELIKLFYAFQYTDYISKHVGLLVDDPHAWCLKKVSQNIPKTAAAGPSRNSTVTDI